MNVWEIVLIVGVMIVLLSVRRGFQPDPTRFNRKRALFYFCMTAAAVFLGWLVALLVIKLAETEASSPPPVREKNRPK